MQAQAIRSSRLIGTRRTLDLRVNHPDHNYYAEGIVVSNSHAVSYGYLTAVTTYLKAKHPLAFYLTMLKLAKEEPNATEYMNTIISEMTRAGIKLLPPDITRSEMDFTIEGPSIRFGLASIKGISEMTFAKLAGLRGKTFDTKFALFDAAKGAAIQINMLCPLIYCGCLSWPNTPRSKLALEAQTYNLLSDAQKGKVKGYGQTHGVDDIIAILKVLPTVKTEKGAPLMAESQIERIRRDYSPYWKMYLANSRNETASSYHAERQLLGFSYTCTLWDIYSKQINGLLTLDEIKRRGAAFAALPPPDEGEQRPRQDPFSFVAFVDDMCAGVSRSNGTPYLKGVCSDDTGSVHVMVYNEERVAACKSFNGRVPEEGDVVLVHGVFSKDGRLVFADSMLIQPVPVMLRKGKETDTPSTP
jgi:DNA polymerase III alpha subunit